MPSKKKSSLKSPKAKSRPAKKIAAKKSAAVLATSDAPSASEVAIFREAILKHLKSTFARDPITATKNDWWLATSMAARDLMLERYIATQAVHSTKNVRRV